MPSSCGSKSVKASLSIILFGGNRSSPITRASGTVAVAAFVILAAVICVSFNREFPPSSITFPDTLIKSPAATLCADLFTLIAVDFLPSNFASASCIIKLDELITNVTIPSTSFTVKSAYGDVWLAP